MYVESVELHYYRNIDLTKVILSPGVNIFFGDNAQGKSNFLESLYVSGTARSHRGSRDRDLIQFGKDEAHIRLFFHKNELSHRLDVHLKKGAKKGIAIDGIPVRRTGELIGMIPIVFFSPEDLSIIKDGPSGRRKFMDMELSMLDPVYMKHLIQYNRALFERNNLLKQIALYPALTETLDGWDWQLASCAKYIIRKREEFLQDTDLVMKEIHGAISGGRENIEVFYEKNVSGQEVEAAIRKNRNKDILSGNTSTGPHRDDIRFTVNNTDIRKYGSQGQQRTAALALKLSELRLIEKLRHEKPVLILDDVLSELDTGRQSFLLDNISRVQTLISCTGLEEFISRRIKTDKIFKVDSGTFSEYSM